MNDPGKTLAEIGESGDVAALGGAVAEATAATQSQVAEYFVSCDRVALELKGLSMLIVGLGALKHCGVSLSGAMFFVATLYERMEVHRVGPLPRH
jgi:hypothetical protein